VIAARHILQIETILLILSHKFYGTLIITSGHVVKNAG